MAFRSARGKRADSKRTKTFDIVTTNIFLERGTARLKTQDATSARGILHLYVEFHFNNMHKVNQVLETQPNFCLPFVGGVTFFNTSRAKAASALKPFHPTKNVIKLDIQGQGLTSCTDTGAQISMTTKSM